MEKVVLQSGGALSLPQKFPENDQIVQRMERIQMIFGALTVCFAIAAIAFGMGWVFNFVALLIPGTCASISVSQMYFIITGIAAGIFGLSTQIARAKLTVDPKTTQFHCFTRAPYHLDTVDEISQEFSDRSFSQIRGHNYVNYDSSTRPRHGAHWWEIMNKYIHCFGRDRLWDRMLTEKVDFWSQNIDWEEAWLVCVNLNPKQVHPEFFEKFKAGLRSNLFPVDDPRFMQHCFDHLLAPMIKPCEDDCLVCDIASEDSKNNQFSVKALNPDIARAAIDVWGRWEILTVEEQDALKDFFS